MADISTWDLQWDKILTLNRTYNIVGPLLTLSAEFSRALRPCTLAKSSPLVSLAPGAAQVLMVTLVQRLLSHLFERRSHNHEKRS